MSEGCKVCKIKQKSIEKLKEEKNDLGFDCAIARGLLRGVFLGWFSGSNYVPAMLSIKNYLENIDEENQES